MKTFMFPGQGSQSRGMGAALFDDFSDIVESADDILGYSIKELCIEDPQKKLNKTEFTQPALYIVNALSYLKEIGMNNEKPDYLIGHSLGEFNALLAAECFSFEDGLKMVKKRGELMSQANEGGMAAILNASKEEIEEKLEEHELTNIDLANYNTPSQIVISGALDEIAKAQSVFEYGEVLYYPLNTSGAFHSRFMKPARDEFEKYISEFSLSNLKIPVISNVTAKPYAQNQVVDNLSSQISSTVRWCDSIEYLLSKNENMEFTEIGHGDVLTKIISTIVQKTRVDSDTPDSRQKSEESVDDKPKTFAEAEKSVKEWNEKNPIGTRVKSLISDYDELETRTEAIVLFGHRAAIYMKGYNGYFDLKEIQAI